MSAPLDDPIEEAKQAYGLARIKELNLHSRFLLSRTPEDRMAFEEAKAKADQLRQKWRELERGRSVRP